MSHLVGVCTYALGPYGPGPYGPGRDGPWALIYMNIEDVAYILCLFLAPPGYVFTHLL